MTPQHGLVAPPQRDRLFLLLSILVATFLVGAICLLGNRQFGGNDQGVLVDIAYRLWNGYRPYVDFPTTQPPLFYLGALWAFRLFGVNWAAFVYAAALYSAVTMAIQLTMLLRLGIERFSALAFAGVVQLAAIVTGSYWWYNPVSCIAVTLLCTATVLVLAAPEIRANWWFYGGCLTLAALAKPNVAGVTIASSTVALLLARATRTRAIVASAAAFAAFVSILFLHSVRIDQLLASYFAAAGRGAPTWQRFIQDQPDYVVRWSCTLIVLALLPLVAHVAWTFVTRTPITRRLSVHIATIGALIAGLYGCFSNGELKIAELPMILVPVGLLCLAHPPRPWGFPVIHAFHPTTFLAVAMSCAAFTATEQAVTRFRVYCIGPGLFYEPAITPVGELNPFFESLYTGDALHRILSEMPPLLKRAEGELHRTPAVFFGPRLTWGYAAFSLMPPRRLPYSWWGGVDYPAQQLPAIVDAFISWSPDYCVFFATPQSMDLTYVPPEIVHVLTSRYTPCYRSAVLVVLRRNDIALGSYWPWDVALLHCFGSDSPGLQPFKLEVCASPTT
jgi:hypothetical protein